MKTKLCTIRRCVAVIISLSTTSIAADLSPTPVAGPSPDSRVFDVKSYGAAGDGTTDDTAALAKAVKAAEEVGGVVQVPAGTYVGTLTITKPGVTLQGAGRDATIIKAPENPAVPATRIIAIAEANHTTIKDFTINGNKAGRTGQKPIAYGLLLFNSDTSTVENVRVINSEQIGIGISGSKNCKVSKCEVDGSAWQNITTLNNKASGCDGTVITGCRSVNAGYDTVQVTNVGAVTVEDCYLANSPFAGIYVSTGARNVTLKNNTITKCYTGIDMSFGGAGGGNGGPDRSEGNVISGNRVTLCQNIGIGTASNGTVITNNHISDIGMNAVVTYTLLGQKTTIASGGSRYSVGDILSFVDGQYVEPGQVQVTAVDDHGSVKSITLASKTTCYHLGAYTKTPPNPISVKGGTGTGASFYTTWNPRALKYAGIAVVDAANVTLTNNTSGNSPGNATQRYGIALLHQFTDPAHLTMSGNVLSGNTVAPVSSVMKAGGTAPP